MAAMRAPSWNRTRKLQGNGSRGLFDALMGRVAQPEGIAYELDTVGAILG